VGNSKYRQIYDNIYGYVNFRKDLFDPILKDPFFLRLHNIKQMGLTYYVFPDALHTRFSHSLGVYSIVTKIINAQKQFSDEPLINEEQEIKMQLSALLHDIGHLPLSHTIESALESFKDFEQKIDDAAQEKESNFFTNPSETTDDSTNIDPINEQNNSKPHVALHEELGEYVLRASGISKFLEICKISYLEISAGFKGDIAFAQNQEIESGSIYYKQIRNFLHSQLDADRIDYLLRDSSFSGVKTGGFDIDKLLNSIRYNDNSDYGIDESSIRALEQFFMSRFVSYCQIVGNKKVQAFEYMAKDFYYRLLKLRKEQNYHLGIRLYSYKDLISDVLIHNPEDFLGFTDEYIFALVREVLSHKEHIKHFDPIIIKYAEKLTKVQPLFAVTYDEGFVDFIKETCFIEYLRNDSNMRQEIANEVGILEDEIIIPDPLKISLYKDGEDKIQIFNGDQIKYSEISECPASIIRYLSMKEMKIYRVFTFDKKNVENLRISFQKRAKDFRFKGDL
jgi:HD superfamily phosphohydrolase